MVLAVVVAALAFDVVAVHANHAGGMDAMSLDMDPHGTPANARAAEYGQACSNSAGDDGDTRINDGCPTTPATVGAAESGFACNDPLIPLDNDLDGVANDGCAETSCFDAADNDSDGVTNDGCPTFGGATLGSRESCSRINENDLLDADEDGTDAVVIDVTATNIPASNSMIAFAFSIVYPSDALTVESHDPGYLLATYPKSDSFDASNYTPDDNDDDRWSAAVVDTGDRMGEYGSGVLSRLTVSSEQGLAGAYSISLEEAAHIDPQNQSHAPDTLDGGAIALDEPCPVTSP
jgi:hypothetical protein